MNTVMPQSELVRRAARWIMEERNARTLGSVSHSLLDEAGMRFNLSPNECRMLEEFFKAGGQDASADSGAHTTNTGNNDASW